MQKPIYVHYGSTFFEPSRNFPISNHRNWSKPFGGLWASRQDATFGWKDWCEREEFRECDENNSFKFQLCDNSKVAIIHCMKDLDCLGSVFMELNFGNKSTSQFFTPYHICELMAKVTEEDVAAIVKEKGYITINDPCCGAGATLIAAVNEARKQLEKVNLNFQNHVLVAAQDIDEIVALMCYIQLSLLGVAAYIKVGNSLTEPMSTDDNGENYWFTMMYFSDVWAMRRLFHSV